MALRRIFGDDVGVLPEVVFASSGHEPEQGKPLEQVTGNIFGERKARTDIPSRFFGQMDGEPTLEDRFRFGLRKLIEELAAVGRKIEDAVRFQDAPKFLDPGDLSGFRKVREDRPGEDEIEGSVRIGKRRVEEINFEFGEGEMFTRPPDEPRVIIAAEEFGVRSSRELAGEASAAAAEIEDRIEIRERPAGIFEFPFHGAYDPGPGIEEGGSPAGGNDGEQEVRGWQWEPVRRAAKAESKFRREQRGRKPFDEAPSRSSEFEQSGRRQQALYAVHLRSARQVTKGDAEVMEESVAEAVDPSMHDEGLTSLPGFADDGGVRDVSDLLDDVHLAEAIDLFRGVGDLREFRTIFYGAVGDGPQPVIDQAMGLFFQRRLDAAAAVMSADDDMPHFEDFDRKLHDREAVQVGVQDEVGDVAVHEKLAGKEPDDLVGRHPAVRTADPKVFGRLLLCKRFEKVVIACPHSVGPLAIIGEKLGECLHGGFKRSSMWIRLRDRPKIGSE